MALDIDDVVARHPSSYPYLLVDKIMGVVSGERGVGLRNVTANDPLLAADGRRPLTMRRALLVEAFAQVAAMILGSDDRRPAALEVTRIESMRFGRSPVPGDQIVLDVALSRDGAAVKAACRAEVGGRSVAEGALELEIQSAQ